MSEDHGDWVFRGYGYHTRIDTGGTGANFHRSLDGCQHSDIKILLPDPNTGELKLDHIEKVVIRDIRLSGNDDFAIEYFTCLVCGVLDTRPKKGGKQVRCSACGGEYKRKKAREVSAKERARAKVNAS